MYNFQLGSDNRVKWESILLQTPGWRKHRGGDSFIQQTLTRPDLFQALYQALGGIAGVRKLLLVEIPLQFWKLTGIAVVRSVPKGMGGDR